MSFIKGVFNSLVQFAIASIVHPLHSERAITCDVTLENVDFETIALSSNPKFIGLIERSRARRRAEGGISSDEMRRRLGLSEV